MKRLFLLAGALALSTGCMSLDFMFLDSKPLEAYDFDPELIDPALVEEVRFDRGDGTQLAGVWLKQDPTQPAPPLIFFHGNSNNLQTDLERIAWYHSWGRYDVFAVDYSGFGASEGEASWENLATRDGVAAIDHASAHTGYATEDIPLLALSLGGFVAIHAADERPLQALVLESVFATSDQLIDESLQLDLPVGWFFEHDWENVRAIEDVISPVLVIHGLADDFIPPTAGPALHDAVRTETELWQPPRAGHADLFQVDPEGYETRANDFIDRFFP